ncbi:MAG: hypothetical protein ACFFDN_07210 [Candidatus Hodarchaeota archaeon]
MKKNNMKEPHISEEIQPTIFSAVAFIIILIGAIITLIGWIRIMDSVQAELYLLLFIDLVSFILLIFSIILTLIDFVIYLDLSPLFSFLDFMMSMSFESGILIFSFILIVVGVILLLIAAVKTTQMKQNKAIPVTLMWFLFVFCIGALGLCIMGHNDIKFRLDNVKNLQFLFYFFYEINESFSITCYNLSIYILLGATNSPPMYVGLTSLFTIDILLFIGTIDLDIRYKSINSSGLKIKHKER